MRIPPVWEWSGCRWQHTPSGRNSPLRRCTPLLSGLIEPQSYCRFAHESRQWVCCPVRSYLTRSLIAEIEQTASRYAHPNNIVWIIVVHKKRIHHSAVSAIHDRRNVSGTGGESEGSSASAQNSLSYWIDVFGLRDSKQEWMWKVRIVELVDTV